MNDPQQSPRPGAGSPAEPGGSGGPRGRGSDGGERLVAGRYRLSHVVGRGAHSVVWAATDTALARNVALKQIRLPAGLGPTDRAAALDRAGRRAQAVSALSHPSVIALYDVVEDGGAGWLVTELVPWPSLAEVIAAHGALASDFVATVGLSALGGLDAAHELAIVHGDVNPANLLVATDGHVKLTDFGIARSATGPASAALAFRAPEVLDGAPPDTRADLWGLGATLATAIRGAPPFGADPEQAAAAIRRDPPPAIDAAAPLAFAIAGLLRKDPAHRLGAGGVRQALVEAGGLDLHDPRQSAQAGGDDQTALLTAAASGVEPDTTRLSATPAPPSAPPATPPAPRPAGGAPARPVRTPPRRRSRARRGPGFTAAAIGLVVVLCVGVAYGAFWLTDTLTDRHTTAEQTASDPAPSNPLGGIGRAPTSAPTIADPTSGAAEGSATAASPTNPPTTQPSATAPTTSATKSDSAIPAGYTRHRDSRGFTVAAPHGWKPAVNPSNHHAVDITAPDGRRFLRLVVSPATTGTLADEFKAGEAQFVAGHQGYHRIQLKPQKFRGHDAILWEFTFSADGTVRHARYLDYIVGDKEYGVYVSAPDAQFSSMTKVFDTALATISVP